MTETLRVGSLFSGIGGIDLGLERTGGFRTAWFAETDPYASAVLKRHWPDVPNLGDVRTIKGGAPSVDVLAGGFPCQPVSLAGKRLGEFDPRWLWPEFARLVGDLRPRIVLVENVPGLASLGLREVAEDLSSLGYDAEWDVVSASAVGAPHIRERLFLVAYPRRARRRQDAGGAHGDEGQDAWRAAEEDHVPASDGQGRGARGVPGVVAGGSDAHDVADTHREPLVWTSESWQEPDPWAAEPDVGRVAHGVPRRMDRLRCLGNGVVPQVAEFVGHLILKAVREGRI